MSKLVKKHWSYFKLLMSTTKGQRKVLVDTITSEQLRALVQIVVNLLEYVLPIKPSMKPQLKKHRNIIRQIGNKTISTNKKEQLLCRQSGLIVILLKSIEPALKSYIYNEKINFDSL